MKLKEKAEEIKLYIPAILIAMKHKETPFLAKLFSLMIVVYALSPIDLIPDFIPVIGLIDDIIILPILIKLVIILIPKELFETYLLEAKTMKGYDKSWFYAVPFILVWTMLIIYIVPILVDLF